MNKICPIIIRESSGLARKNEPVTFGIPFPKGVLKELSYLSLKNRKGEDIPLQTESLATWPDKSIKWVLLDFQASVELNTIEELDLFSDTKSKENFPVISIRENQTTIIVNTNSAIFEVNKKVFKPFENVTIDSTEILNSENSITVLEAENGQKYSPIINQIYFETKGPLRCTLKIEGEFKESEGTSFSNFFSRISFYANQSFVKIDFTIHNPKAAKHPEGLWDLGDPGSLFFKDLSLSQSLFPPEKKTSKCIIEDNKSFNTSKNISIYQDSSGGENWKSKNHINKDGEVKTSFRGYKICEEQKTIKEGNRANPSASISNENAQISIALLNFWQNFPKALECSHKNLTISLYPRQFNDLFELQGGEQKTHTFFLDYSLSSKNSAPLNWIQIPLLPIATPAWYAESGAIEYLVPESGMDDNVKNLINVAVNGDKSFFKRREIIDEYGWRNFGELYADHEAVGHEGSTPLISHYNNQYDGINGLLRQYLSDGDEKWFLLGAQLANHVRDIDVYHTDEDRPEYNRGLFWHTDHYIDAETCTHRCFSKKHLEKRKGIAYGGGPSLSHNYATGLFTHYYLTGEKLSFEIAMDLAEYVKNNINIETTFSNQAFQAVKQVQSFAQNAFNKKDLVQMNKVFSLNGPGRASGNSLSCMVDAYKASGDKAYIEMAEDLMKICVHPRDKPEEMDLLDFENRWMYTVFLQALGKYLDVKIEKGEQDENWRYGKESLLCYAEWMLENEYPYLSKPEKLEYPNETWGAQEIRKCNVLLYTSKFVSKERMEFFREKASYFYNQGLTYLHQYETKRLTRPILLLMQNGMMHQAFNKENHMPEFEERVYRAKYRNKSLSKSVIMFKNFSFKKELLFIRSKALRKK